MPDQNHSHDYMTDVARAENHKQEAIRQAHAAFDSERADTLNKWSEAVQAAQSAFDRLKSKPEHPQHDDARASIEALRSNPPDYQQARNNLAAAVRAADDAYHADVAAARAKHGVLPIPEGR